MASSNGHEDADDQKRYNSAYTPHHQIPTIAKYREEKAARQAEAGREGADGADLGPSKTDRAKESWKSYWYGQGTSDEAAEGGGETSQQDTSANKSQIDVDGDGDVDEDDEEATTAAVDTSEATPIADPKKRRKALGKKEERADREVTDPVTHLPVKVFDYTTEALNEVEENPPPFGRTIKTATGLSNKNKSDEELHEEQRVSQNGLDHMQALFPPPNFDVIRQDLISINKTGITVGLTGSAAIFLTALGVERVFRSEVARLFGSQDQSNWLAGASIWIVLTLLSAGGVWYLIAGVRAWMANRINDTWEDQVWEANLEARQRETKAHETESVTWLNQLLGSVWPLINPDLFTSLADTLEDVMQASLPRLVQMVSVDDIGQGSESLRVLGIRWLPSGAAARSVGSGGHLESAKQKKSNDRAVPGGDGEIDDTAEDRGDKGDDGQKPQEQKDKNKPEDGSEKTEVAEGMEAEEGDFINLEVAFAYRARKSKSFKDRTKDIHLYLAFWLPGNIKIPVWVDVRGVVGTARLRLQLTPDPPFFALCTLTFMGQPKVDIGCIPLVKRGPNIMDLPLISNFVQASVDAAMAQYVAPKSLTLDLKDMVAGDDYKKNTAARGVLIVYIKRGYDFKMGDAAIPGITDGSSDPYVTLSWAKFGKPIFSTRVLVSEMEPYWHERAALLVTPDELNVDERLRLQLWDSDRFTADDDLGRIEVDVKQLMRAEETNGRMCDRADGFRALKAGDNMPGKLEWSVGYYSKVRLQPCQFEKQTFDDGLRSMEQLEKRVDENCRRKLREARIKKGRHSRDADELQMQRAQEMREMENAIIISAPPPEGYLSGIFSIQIHQITGLELEQIQGKTGMGQSSYGDDEGEEGESVPSAYCNVIINHKKVFKTRTKPKNGKPFYNAGTERYIPNWQEAEAYVAVRDARVGEDDPLLGIVHLPLSEVFKERAQVNGFYPLTGGIGYGRIRLSMVWRSVELRAPREALGWEVGTIEIKPSVSMDHDIPGNLQDYSLKFHTNIGSGTLYSYKSDRVWKARKERSLFLPVKTRYASCLAVRFKRSGVIKEKTVAFGILWLKDIPDDEEKQLELPIYKGNFERARACCIEDPGEKVGTIKIRVVFWSGLGPTHQRVASRDPNMKNVMEVLDVARDNYESRKKEEEAGIVGDGKDDSSLSSSDESDGDGEVDSEEEEEEEEEEEAGEDGHMNVFDKARDYKKYAKEQHRRNRGLMQYKVPRTANWVTNKGARVGHKFSGIFKRHTREPGVETEV